MHENIARLFLLRIHGGFRSGPETKTPCSQYMGWGSAPGWGARFHMPQIRVSMPQLKIPNAATRTVRTIIKEKKKRVKII